MNNFKEQPSNQVDKDKKEESFNHFKKIVSYIQLNYQQMNHLIFIWMYLLIFIGLIFIFSATMINSGSISGIGTRAFDLIIRQSISVVLGTFLIIVLMLVPHDLYKKYKIVLFINFLFVLLLGYTLLFGETDGGAQNWVTIIIRFQPSEFSKLAIIVFFSLSLSLSQRYYHEETKKLDYRLTFQKNYPRQLYCIGVIAISVLLLAKMPDYGMIIMILSILLFTFAVYVLNFWQNVILYSLIVVGYLLLRIFTSRYSEMLIKSESYQLNRLGIFSNPFNDQLNKGYQSIQALIAFSRGGLFGKGIGKGITKQISLPAAHTDFIFAVMGEEIGFVGIMLFLFFMFGFYAYLLFLSLKFKNNYRRILGISIVIMFIIQSIINIGGALALIPLTGLTLPFISYGGTSILVCMAAVGIFQSLYIQEKIDALSIEGETYGV